MIEARILHRLAMLGSPAVNDLYRTLTLAIIQPATSIAVWLPCSINSTLNQITKNMCLLSLKA